MDTTKRGGANRAVARSHLLRERAYAELKRLILGGKLAKAPFLSTRNLARHLGMSLSPVRSAVERLETEGLLAIGPQRGIVINELTTAEIIDHYEIRQSLESLVVRKLAGRLSIGQVEELRSNLAEHQRSIAQGSIEQFIALDGEFHFLLAEFAGNADVERVLRQLRDRIFRVVLRVIEHVPQRLRATLDEHRQIVDQLERGEGDAAVETMTFHLRGGLQALIPSDNAIPLDI